MSVANVMETITAQESTASEAGATAMPAGETSTGKPSVKSIEDVFNLYDGDEEFTGDNGKELKEDKSQIPDELNNVTPKEIKKEEILDDKEDVKNSPEVKTEEVKVEKPLPSTVKVKVNGVEQEVPLQDVINSYSGQQEIQRRFTEFDKQKKTFEKEIAEKEGFSNYVKEEIGSLRESFDGLINQYQKNGFMDKNPLEAVNQLLDKMGINSNLFERAVFEHQLPEYAKFFNMTETERDAHYTKRENDYLRRKEQGFIERDQQVKFREENQRKDFDLIKNAGLDTERYHELSNELAEAGHKDLTAEKVVEYARQKPTLDKVAEIFNTIGENPVGNEKARTVFKILQEFPDTTMDEILDHLDPNRAALKTAQVLSSKAPKVSRVQSNNAKDADFDEMLSFYKN